MNRSWITLCLACLLQASAANAATVAWYRFEDEGGLHAQAVTLADSVSTRAGESLTQDSLYYVPVTNGYPANGMGALAFFGTERAQIPDPVADQELEDAFTIELLLRPFQEVRNPNRWHTILLKRASDDPESEVTFRLDYHPQDREYRCIWRLRGESGQYSNAGVGADCHPSPNGWHHLAVLSDAPPDTGYEYGSFFNGYMSTHAGGTDELVAALGDGPFLLGGEGSGTDGFHGLIDEIRISDQALEPVDFLVQFPTFQEAELTITPKVEISFPTTPYDFHALDWSADLNEESWTELKGGVSGTGFPVTITDTNGFGQQRFYRLRVYD